MKSYEKVTNDLLERRDRYIADQKRKRKRAISITTPLCCLCIIALLGFGIGRTPDTVPSDYAEDGAIITGGNDSLYDIIYSFDEDSNTQQDGNKIRFNHRATQTIIGCKPHIESKYDEVIFNPVEIGILDIILTASLMTDEFVEMSHNEMIEYYGVDYLPNLPDDIKLQENEHFGIYKKKGETGEVYWDNNTLKFANNDFTRTVSLNIYKLSDVYLGDYLFSFTGAKEKSVINDTELLVGATDYGLYYAEFMYNGVGFHLNTEGVTQEEFIEIISSIFY